MFAGRADFKQLSTAAVMAPLIVGLLKDRFAPFQFVLPMAVQACDKFASVCLVIGPRCPISDFTYEQSAF